MSVETIMDEKHEKQQFCTYLLTQHTVDLKRILKEPDEYHHYAIVVSFVKLFEVIPDSGNELLTNPTAILKCWDRAAVKAQKRIQNDPDDEERIGYTLKQNVHIRVSELPACPELHRNIFPKNQDLGYFLKVIGTVIRTGAVNMLEYKRTVVCKKCKHETIVEAEFERKFTITNPTVCRNPNGCTNATFETSGEKLTFDGCKDYQEIKIQEQLSNLSIGSIPSCVWVALENDLVDTCKPGDDVGISGVVCRRFSHITPGKRPDVELVMRANYVEIYNEQRYNAHVNADIQKEFVTFWQRHSSDPFVGRNMILDSFCPQIFGMSLVKLAVCLTLAGGARVQDVKVRHEPHLLMVGDPGTGKSQMLRWAAKCVPRSVLTTGIGSTAAGLTVTAVMEDGQWQLEAGALVLADGGVCCIDEFNSMRTHDRASIHEAMEQQTISVAKASMVCKLSTKCSIIAAANFKSNYDRAQPLEQNIAIAAPLLSRFDLVIVLRDNRNAEWDRQMTDFILNEATRTCDRTSPWSLQTLQSYFLCVKMLNPRMTPDAHAILSTYYQYERQKPTRSAARTTVRLLDAVIRLSQAHARFMFREDVLVMDALWAIHLNESAHSNDLDLYRAHFKCPRMEYCQILTDILSRLGLGAILKRELERWNVSAGS